MEEQEESSEYSAESRLGAVTVVESRRVKRIAWNKCLCHNENLYGIDKDELKEIRTDSWRSIVAAARYRQDEIWKFLLSQDCADENAACRGYFHKRCYSSYTHKKNVKKCSSITSIVAQDIKKGLGEATYPAL